MVSPGVVDDPRAMLLGKPHGIILATAIDDHALVTESETIEASRDVGGLVLADRNRTQERHCIGIRLIGCGT
jgi:hypothetical protein